MAKRIFHYTEQEILDQVTDVTKSYSTYEGKLDIYTLKFLKNEVQVRCHKWGEHFYGVLKYALKDQVAYKAAAKPGVADAAQRIRIAVENGTDFYHKPSEGGKRDYFASAVGGINLYRTKASVLGKEIKGTNDSNVALLIEKYFKVADSAMIEQTRKVWEEAPEKEEIIKKRGASSMTAYRIEGFNGVFEDKGGTIVAVPDQYHPFNLYG